MYPRQGGRRARFSNAERISSALGQGTGSDNAAASAAASSLSFGADKLPTKSVSRVFSMLKRPSQWIALSCLTPSAGADGHLCGQTVPFRVDWRTDYGRIRGLDNRIAADDDEGTRRFWIAGRPAHAVDVAAVHSLSTPAWNESTSAISAFSLAAWRLIWAISRASRRACASPSTNSRTMRSTTAERDSVAPARMLAGSRRTPRRRYLGTAGF
jgi:hypothetical protein